VKSVSGFIHGVTGFVFNDFLDTFEIEDIDGERYSEVSWMMIIDLNYTNYCHC
jgi:hypothetical protein